MFAGTAQVHNTPDGHVTRDYREGLGTLADLQFTAIDTSGAVPISLCDTAERCPFAPPRCHMTMRRRCRA